MKDLWPLLALFAAVAVMFVGDWRNDLCREEPCADRMTWYQVAYRAPDGRIHLVRRGYIAGEQPSKEIIFTRGSLWRKRDDTIEITRYYKHEKDWDVEKAL